MGATKWPEQDETWLARYRTSVANKNVPRACLDERERELLNAVLSAGQPASELFGDATTLATEDAAELATAEEAVRSSDGGGLRPFLREIGGSLTGLASVSIVYMLVRNGWQIDITAARALVAVSVAFAFLAWVVGRALYSAGRTALMVSVVVAAGAVAVGGIAWASSIGPDHVIARNVPVLVLGAGLLMPGIIVLVIASKTPDPTLRTDWDDDEWLRRFKTGLRTRLVPVQTTQGHVTEAQHALAAGNESAYTEFGHPLVLARELADADRTARARRWWSTIILGAGTSLTLAALVLVNALDTGADILTIPAMAIFIFGALATVTTAWSNRPWKEPR